MWENNLRLFTTEERWRKWGWNTFLNRVLQESEHLVQHLKTNVPMNFTQEDEIVHNQTTHCHICDEKMESKDKVQDHCHLTGKYREAAHYKCNLAFKYSKYIPVFFTTWKDMTPIFSCKILENTKRKAFLHCQKHRKVHFSHTGSFMLS